MKVKKKYTWKERQELKKALSLGYTIERLASETGLSPFTIRTEIKDGMLEEDYKKRLYGTYCPELAIYEKIKKDFDEESIEAFIKWRIENGKES